MSSRVRTEYPKDGDQKEAGDSNVPQSPTGSSQSPALSHIPQSPTCRKIFFDESFKVAPFPEASLDVIEQQRLKWNFDFQTETPLPGRYLWMSTQSCSGYYKNGKGAPQQKRLRRGDDKKRLSKMQRHSGQSVLRSERVEEKKDTESGGSCDTALNEPPESRKSLRLSESPVSSVDWT